MKMEVASLRKQQEYMETYQRRERFYGIPEKSDGKEDSYVALMDFLKNYLHITSAEDIEIQRVHRVGKFDSEQENPRPIIARFLRYPDREYVYSRAKHLKDTGM